MNARQIVALGFVQQFILPFATMLLAIILYSRDSSFSAIPIIAAYPVGMIFLVGYPLLLRRDRRNRPNYYIKLAKGARWATIAVAAVSIPVFLILADALDQRVLGLGLLAVGFGFTWIPIASAASALGYAILDGDNVEQFLHLGKRSPFNFEGLSILFLRLFLNSRKTLAKTWRASLFIFFPLGFYVSGWIFLGISISLPVALFGLVIGLLVPISSRMSLSPVFSVSNRFRILQVLDGKLANSPQS
jgi:hypothetical protein